VIETLDQRRRLVALLARQLLLERAELPIVEAVERLGGLQTQYAPSGYVGLWSRLVNLDRQMLTSSLERREVIQGTLMRATIHTVSAADYWPMAIAIRRSRREWYDRVWRSALAGHDMAAAVRIVRRELRSGPRPARDLKSALGAAGLPTRAFTFVGVWVDLVRVPPSGTWGRRRADLYALAEDWLTVPAGIDEASGLDLLVRRYLGGFGPARIADIAGWAGVGVATLAPAIERSQLRRFHDEQGAELVDAPDAPLPPASTEGPIRFLAHFDPTLLVHQRATQILPEQYRQRVFNVRAPQDVATFLVDGQVAGLWRYRDGRIEVEPFAQLPARARHTIDEEAARLAAFHQ
jgi:hypothetical protein